MEMAKYRQSCKETLEIMGYLKFNFYRREEIERGIIGNKIPGKAEEWGNKLKMGDISGDINNKERIRDYTNTYSVMMGVTCV